MLWDLLLTITPDLRGQCCRHLKAAGLFENQLVRQGSLRLIPALLYPLFRSLMATVGAFHADDTDAFGAELARRLLGYCGLVLYYFNSIINYSNLARRQGGR